MGGRDQQVLANRGDDHGNVSRDVDSAMNPSRDADTGLPCDTNKDCPGNFYCSSHTCWIQQFMGRDQQVLANRGDDYGIVSRDVDSGLPCETSNDCPAMAYCSSNTCHHPILMGRDQQVLTA